MAVRVLCALYDRFLMVDLIGACGAFEFAAISGGLPPYICVAVADTARQVRSSSGLTVSAVAYDEETDFDVLLIPGAPGARDPATFAGLLPLIRKAAAREKRIVAMSSGVFLLAEAGILDGRRVVTHWGLADEFNGRYPAVQLDTSRLFLRDRNIWTAAGIGTGSDVALALIAQDHGAAAAQRIARAMLIPFRRFSSDAQRSSLGAPPMLDERFSDLMAWAQEHLHEPLPIERLADRAAMSVRHFTRVFGAACGVSPAKAVETMRVERARGMIEASYAGLETVAQATGFDNAERMRRSFTRILGVTPQQIRRGARPEPFG